MIDLHVLDLFHNFYFYFFISQLSNQGTALYLLTNRVEVVKFLVLHILDLVPASYFE